MDTLATVISAMLPDATAAAVAMATIGVTISVISLVKRRA